MTTITFDTQELVNELESSGFTRQQSETVVAVLKKAQGELATKADLQREISGLKQELKVMSSELRVDLMKWMTGALIAQAAVIATLVKLL